jgi:predicted cupin superfamily sugar epimerase
MTIDELKRLLRLEPLAGEGGCFAETYRARESLPAGAFGLGWPGPRSLATAIYYLLTAETYSALHHLRSDESFHFYLGDPAEMLQLMPDGRGRTVRLGTDLAAGMRAQVMVPKGVWQGSRLVPGGDFALLGTTVSPGFDRADYEAGSRQALIAAYPAFSRAEHSPHAPRRRTVRLGGCGGATARGHPGRDRDQAAMPLARAVSTTWRASAPRNSGAALRHGRWTASSRGSPRRAIRPSSSLSALSAEKPNGK